MPQGNPVIKVNKRFIPISWFGASLVAALFIITTILRHRNRLNKMDEVDDSNILKVLNENKARLDIKQDIKLLTGIKDKGPYIFGIGNPIIYIPKNILDDSSNNQIEYMLLHELYHHKRKDLLVNSFQLLALVLHWFNPLVWLMNKYMREDRELACDNSVMEELGQEESIEYGLMLIEVARKNLKLKETSLVGVYFSLNKKQTKRRIKMINNFKKITFRKKVTMLLGIILLASFILTNGVGLANKIITPRKIEDGIKNRFEVKSKSMKFYNLERAKDFLDEDIKIPTKIKDGYNFEWAGIAAKDTDREEFSMTFEDKKRNSISIGSSKSYSEKEILSGLYRDDMEVKAEDKKIGDIEGRLITSRLEGQLKYEEFIWKDGDRYYSFRKNRIVYANIVENESKPFMDTNTDYLINSKETEELINSFTPINKVDAHDYISTRNRNTVCIYDETDLVKAKKELGSEPRIVLNLGENFKARDLEVGRKYYERVKEDMMVFTTFFTISDDGENHFTLEQSTDSQIYDDLVENSYTEIFGEKADTELIKIRDTDVYKSSVECPGDEGNRFVHFNWKDGTDYFQIDFQSQFNEGINFIDIIEEILESK